MRKTLTIILLVTLAFLCSSFVSTNVPLEHFSYDAIDKLIGRGLIDSAMLTTRPLSRLEMARLIAEAAEKAQQSDEKNEIILAILDRLKTEFKTELNTIDTLGGGYSEDFIKPIEDPYIILLLIEKSRIFQPESTFCPINSIYEGLYVVKRKNS